MSVSSADRPRGVLAFVALAAAACVAYDPAGPPVPSLDGVWQVVFTIRFESQVEVRADTLRGLLTLHGTHDRGRFSGTYRFGTDTGDFGGVIRPEGTLVVDQFGAPPKPIAAVDTLRLLYRWCDFTRLGTGGLSGRLLDDTLSADGQASLPCFYSQFGTEVELPTQLAIAARAVR